MNITFTGVVAMAADRAIGLNNTMPWHLPGDLKLFKRLTMGHPILMGRKTWQSLGRPLPGRQNIVLTRDTAFVAPGATVIHDITDLQEMELQSPEVMVIGGAQIYELMLPHMSALYVSEVQGEWPADTYFPPFREHFTRREVQERFEGFDSVLYSRS
ncbi:MAG: dihydrofolate reductase [Akkermansia sp.]|nr:dihydrofolate reductase [Akkermansia sp.]